MLPQVPLEQKDSEITSNSQSKKYFLKFGVPIIFSFTSIYIVDIYKIFSTELFINFILCIWIIYACIIYYKYKQVNSTEGRNISKIAPFVIFMVIFFVYIATLTTFDPKYNNLEKPVNIEIRNKVRARSLMIQTISAGYEFVLVATGKIEARICFDPFGKDYDFAPGSLLVSEAGGIVANIGSAKYDYRNTNLIAGNKSVFENYTSGEAAIFPLNKTM